MSKPIIIECASLINPKAFSTVEELRRELDRVNDIMLDQTMRLQETKSLLAYFNHRLVSLVEAHIQGRQLDLTAELSELSGHYLKEKEARSGSNAQKQESTNE